MALGGDHNDAQQQGYLAFMDISHWPWSEWYWAAVGSWTRCLLSQSQSQLHSLPLLSAEGQAERNVIRPYPILPSSRVKSHTLVLSHVNGTFLKPLLSVTQHVSHSHPLEYQVLAEPFSSYQGISEWYLSPKSPLLSSDHGIGSVLDSSLFLSFTHRGRMRKQ